MFSNGCVSCERLLCGPPPLRRGSLRAMVLSTSATGGILYRRTDLIQAVESAIAHPGGGRRAELILLATIRYLDLNIGPRLV